MSSTYRHKAILAFLTALALAVSACAKPAPQQQPTPGQTESDKTKGPAPREGPQTNTDAVEEIDAAHQHAVQAFPAKTEGVGGQPLTPRIENGVKVFDLEAKVVQWEVEPGVKREAWTYNGMTPGPLIRVKEGDHVRINLKNSLGESTALHPHGMENEGPFNKFDGVSYLNSPPVKPGQTGAFEFIAYPPGTHMYHSHHDSTKQVALGMLGPLIVDPKDPTGWPKADKEYVMVLNDGPLGYTINGKSFPATEPLTAKQGQKVLVRWMHEGALMHPMHLHGPAMTVVARDGHLLKSPQTLDVLTINPGERWDVLLDTSKTGVWAWHCHVLPHAEGEKGLYGLTTVVKVEP
jgi:FtsP/CotA-like multicopper oxidase with cupredoxin domain